MGSARIDMKRKPNLFAKSRDITTQQLSEAYGDIIIESSSDDIKNVLLLIKIDQTYEKNSNALKNIDVPFLRDTLDYLRTGEGANQYQYKVDDYLKSGLIFEIISTLSRILPHKCKGCQKVIRNDERMKSHQCVGCGCGPY